LLLTGISPWFAPIVGLILVFGISDSVTLVAEQGIRQRRTPDALRSRVMAASEATWQLALPASYLIAGAILGVVGPQGVYALGGVAAVLAALILVPVLLQMRREAALVSEHPDVDASTEPVGAPASIVERHAVDGSVAGSPAATQRASLD